MTDSGLDSVQSPQCLVNGQQLSELSVLDRGLAYGDGLFETMRVAEGRIALLEYHLARLRRGIAALKMEADLTEIVTELNMAAAQLHNGVLKMILTRGLGKRGYGIPSPVQPTRICQSLPPVDYPVDNARNGVRLFECQTRMAIQPLLAGIKHLNRLEQVLARSEWSDTTYAEGMVRDTSGNVIECTMSNIFMLHEGRWVTPDVSGCGVQGIMRDYLIDQLGQIDDPVEVMTVDLSTLMESTEVFCCNSLFGVWPVIGLKNASWPIGPRTRQAQRLAEQVI
ncbi:aminodeoxychorismate lyase [uncultured Halopseudomonas sp.]|uniref:aminodeoxychorismate lyase n=1 Tax=uncultured Halopseudomonas sp. TaxID=2901193 RepID=UPI0030EB1E9A|tara:strand:- start:45321 stop:46163 length:843 start_codon:yes stop_codon:yes gene_type:complete